MFALICDNVGNDEQRNKHGFISIKTQNIVIKVIEEVSYNEIEDEALQIFLCNKMMNINVEANISKNHEERIAIEAKVS